MSNANLELYYYDSCPFCQKVLRYMDSQNITLTMHNILEDEQAAQTLVEVGGKRQVPCLFIDGVALYESDDIIDYLKTHN